jgi:hypothetical protein
VARRAAEVSRAAYADQIDGAAFSAAVRGRLFVPAIRRNGRAQRQIDGLAQNISEIIEV